MKIFKLKVKEGKRQSPRRIRIRFHFALLAGLLGTAVSVKAQNYGISWYKIAGGGGMSAGGAYQINATVGQPDASSAMSGGNYSLTAGFWSLVSVVQTPGAPTLYICPSGNTVTVYWQNVSGYTLQQGGDCYTAPGWTTCPCSLVTSNGTNYVNVTCTGQRLFFRLCKQ